MNSEVSSFNILGNYDEGQLDLFCDHNLKYAEENLFEESDF